MAKLRAGGGRLESLQTEVLDTTGEVVPVLLSASLINDGDTPIGSVVVFTDIREKMRMEQRLQQAQDQILAQERQAIVAELAGAAAHELNQPLTSVMAYAELLMRMLAPPADASGEAQTWKAAQVIHEQAERMAEIVRKIGKITKYETKSYVGQARILDLDKAAASEPGLGKQDEPPKSGPSSRSERRSSDVPNGNP